MLLFLGKHIRISNQVLITLQFHIINPNDFETILNDLTAKNRFRGYESLQRHKDPLSNNCIRLVSKAQVSVILVLS